MDPYFLGENPNELADRLEKLAADLRKLAAGHAPGEGMPAAGPLLLGWQITRKEVFCLAGTVHGHPGIGDGRLCRTSPLVAIDRQRRWARSVSRFYELGAPGMFGVSPDQR